MLIGESIIFYTTCIKYVLYLFEGTGDEVNEGQPEHHSQDPASPQQPAEHHHDMALARGTRSRENCTTGALNIR